MLLVSLFIPWVGHGKNMISTAKKAETTQQQQHFMTAKQWEKVHAAYALKPINLKIVGTLLPIIRLTIKQTRRQHAYFKT